MGNMGRYKLSLYYFLPDADFSIKSQICQNPAAPRLPPGCTIYLDMLPAAVKRGDGISGFPAFSDDALEYARAFTESHGSHLLMLHVIEFPSIPLYSDHGEADTSFPTGKVRSSLRVPDGHSSTEKIKQQCQDRLDELIEKYNGDGLCKISSDVVFGKPFVEIVKKAREDGFDLIVLGTHGRSALRHILIGSVAEKVVRKAYCPVLTVKHPEHEFVMP